MSPRFQGNTCLKLKALSPGLGDSAPSTAAHHVRQRRRLGGSRPGLRYPGDRSNRVGAAAGAGAVLRSHRHLVHGERAQVGDNQGVT